MEQEVGPAGKSLEHHSEGRGVSFQVEITGVRAVVNRGGVCGAGILTVAANLYWPSAWPCAELFSHQITHSRISHESSRHVLGEAPIPTVQPPALPVGPGLLCQRPLSSSRRPGLHDTTILRTWNPQRCLAGGLFFPLPRGCSVARACHGDIFGWPGCLAWEIHQPASSALASPDHVLICQSVGFLYTYSSIFVSGEIAFVFLRLLINPSVALRPPHSA